jgi:divinyl chlorophyllide a 8-vinyl-reductase
MGVTAPSAVLPGPGSGHSSPLEPVNARPRRVLVLGASGTIGRATVRALAQRGHEVVAFMRPRADASSSPVPAGVVRRLGEATDPASLAQDGFRGERFDAVVSCLASRTGVPRDAWSVDHLAHRHALAAAKAAGVAQFVLLSALCVQKPRLSFQLAKRAFEGELMASGIAWSIVRPTAFFKSLCGQVERVRAGRPFLLFGDGRLTACKPIADEDLAEYLADCLDDPAKVNRLLPIGGPGPAITPLQQGQRLFELLGRAPRFRHVPVMMLDAIAATLGVVGRVWPAAADKAELARIGRYYATESMLVWDEAAGRYDADATPETGTRTLFELYARLAAGEAAPDRGEHAVF